MEEHHQLPPCSLVALFPEAPKYSDGTEGIFEVDSVHLRATFHTIGPRSAPDESDYPPRIQSKSLQLRAGLDYGVGSFRRPSSIRSAVINDGYLRFLVGRRADGLTR